MPIYEYYCQDCRKRVSVFFRSFTVASDADAQCPTCDGQRLRRLVSRVSILKSDESRIESADDPALLSGMENEDPRALAHFMRKMSNEMGEPLDAEMNEVLGRLEAGESPAAIEQSMPELAGGDAGAGGDSALPDID